MNTNYILLNCYKEIKLIQFMKRKKKNYPYEINLLSTNITNYKDKVPYDELTKNLIIKHEKSDSWFDIEKANYSYKTLTRNIENLTNKKIIKTRKIILQPSEEQHKTLTLWFECYRKMYNETISVIRRLKYEKNKKYLNARYLRTKELMHIKYNYMNKTKIHSHTLDGAIRLACANYKSALTNLKNKNIDHFNIRYIKQTKKIKLLDLEKSCFSKGGFCIRELGHNMKNNDNFDYKTIKCDSKLIYNTKTNIYTLLVSYYANCNDTQSNKIISIDPGQKTFLTCLSGTDIYKIGNNLTENIKSKIERMDYLHKINNKKSKKLKNKISLKLTNQITDLHWKCINYILNTEKFGHIMIGNWSTRTCMSKEQYLKSMNKRIINRLSYYKFLQRLEFKCIEYNVHLNITEEAYTSKVCSRCGTLCNKFVNRKLICSNCEYIIDRDINGALNMLFKNL